MPRSNTLIVCEGETERLYFRAARDHFRLTTAEIRVADDSGGSAPISVVEAAEEIVGKQGPYDRVFCVFDRNGHESFDRARDRIKHLAGRARSALPIAEAISVPCFEFWVLLHFERSERAFGRCAEVVQYIRARHEAEYEKADDAICRNLMAQLDQAVANAAWVASRAQETNFNPFTSAHAVVEHMRLVALIGPGN